MPALLSKLADWRDDVLDFVACVVIVIIFLAVADMIKKERRDAEPAGD
jgi:hypothetical protein